MNSLDAPEALLDQLLDLERLDQIPRTGYLQRGVEPAESASEHSWHVATVAWTLAAREPGLDTLRVLELALFHDVGEILLGDIPRPGAALLPAGAKATAETAALRTLLGASGERATALIDELEARASREARFVHACDRLQLILKTFVYARWNRGGARRFLSELIGALPSSKNNGKPEFELVDQVAQQLAARAKSEGLVPTA